MGKVDRNKKDMPVPDFAYVDRKDARAYVIVVDEDNIEHKRTIGHLTDCSEGSERMVPNQYFKNTYPGLFSEAYPGERIPAYAMSAGMYALTLGIGIKTGLYSILQDVYGMLYSNNILDYCMFSIQYRLDVTQLFDKTMNRQVLFCDKLHSDSWYSDFFYKKMNEDLNHQFRIKWVQTLVSKGLKNVWLCIDGSNNDCEARRSCLAKYGFPKSHNANKTIVGYMYVIDAATGRPVTYYVYNGSVPDSQAFQYIATFLGGFDIEIEGIILDRGFAVESVFETIAKKKWSYVVMLPGDTYGHARMMDQYSESIRWKSQYALENEALFGIVSHQKLFGLHERTSDICLFFDGAGNSIQSIRLIKKIQNAKKKIEAAIANGTKASVPKQLTKYMAIEGEGSDRKLIVDYDQWDQSMACKGFYSMAVSEGIKPDRAAELYKMRDPSETQYCILKSQEGGQTTRVHRTESILNKFAVMFITSIIRFEIEHACRDTGLDTNPTIQELNEIILLYTAEGKYEAVKNLNAEQKELFSRFNLEQDDIDRIAREYNSRKNKNAKNPDRTASINGILTTRINSHKRGRKSSKDSNTSSVTKTDKPKNKGGRPKGVKDSKPRKQRADKGKKRGPRSGN